MEIKMESTEIGVQIGTEKVYPGLEDLTVTPSAEIQQFKSNKYGYDNVTVRAVESDTIIVEPTREEQLYNGLYNRVIVNGEPNLVPENIKTGENVFGVEGTYGNLPLDLTDIYGNLQIKSGSGKNLFNKNKDFSYSNIDISNWVVAQIENGLRIQANYSGGSPYIRYVVTDLTDYVGKTVRLKADFSCSGNNTGRYTLVLCNEQGSNPLTQIQTDTSGEIISFVVPNLDEGRTYLGINLYSNGTGTQTSGNYVDYKDVIVTIDNENMEYEPILHIRHTGLDNTIQIKLNRRNILPSANSTRTINGITFTHNSDGSITVNGTATANATYNINENVGYVSQTVPLKANTKYILSAGVETLSSSTYIVQAYFRLNGSLVYKLMTKTGTLIETVEETVLGVYIRVYSGVTVKNLTFYPMIEEVTDDETVASEYHPYNSIKLVDNTTATISVGTGDITEILLN